MEIRLEPHIGDQEQDTPLGKVKESVRVPNQWLVYVYDEALKDRPREIPAGKLHVGIIGTHRGANFCENYNFSDFSPSQKEFIVSECKRLHGQASVAAPVALPPLQSIDDEADEIDGSDALDDMDSE